MNGPKGAPGKSDCSKRLQHLESIRIGLLALIHSVAEYDDFPSKQIGNAVARMEEAHMWVEKDIAVTKLHHKPHK